MTLTLVARCRLEGRGGAEGEKVRLRAPENGLDAFAGCVVVISHDRWFLDRVATHILAFEGDSKVTFFDGNFTGCEEWRKKQLDDAATRPHRITYQKLTR